MKSPSKVVKKTVKAWTVVFRSGLITYWSADLHPIFTKRKYAAVWAKDLYQNAMLDRKPAVVPCTISYQITLPKKGKK